MLKIFYMDKSHSLCTPLVVRHWNKVKNIFCYLRGVVDMSLFYSNVSKIDLIDYTYEVICHIQIMRYSHFIVICETNYISHII
ncbi:hypothetical protein CR513_58593, partial [Mucuna pruriens]